MTVQAVSAERGSDADLVAAIQELQRLKFSVVSGASNAANIAVSGITTQDTLVAVLRFDVAADTGTSATGNKVQAVGGLLSEASITSNGNVQLSTTDTTGDTLVVVWFDKS